MIANLSILRQKEKIIYEYVFNLSFQTKESAGSTDTDDHVILNLSLASGILLFFISLFIRSIFWNGAVLFEVFPCERNPSVFQLFKRILAPLSLLISYIMTPNISTLLLIRKRILILNLMLLHRKRQKSKKSAWVRKIFEDRTKKGEFHLLVRDLRLHDHQYQCSLHSIWFQASCEAFRREKVELVSAFQALNVKANYSNCACLVKFRGAFAAEFASRKSAFRVLLFLTSRKFS